MSETKTTTTASDKPKKITLKQYEANDYDFPFASGTVELFPKKKIIVPFY